MKNINVIQTNKISFNNLLEDLISCFKHKDTMHSPSELRTFVELLLIEPVWVDNEALAIFDFINILIEYELILVVDENGHSQKIRSTQKLEDNKVKLLTEFERGIVKFVPMKESVIHFVETNGLELSIFVNQLNDYLFNDDSIAIVEQYVNDYAFDKNDILIKHKESDRWINMFIDWLSENK